jgi:hypothetical protein
MLPISRTARIGVVAIVAATLLGTLAQARETPYLIGKTSRFDAVALNPQPLPPKEIGTSVRNFDTVMLNPQPLPPEPPPEHKNVFQLYRTNGN